MTYLIGFFASLSARTGMPLLTLWVRARPLDQAEFSVWVRKPDWLVKIDQPQNAAGFSSASFGP